MGDQFHGQCHCGKLSFSVTTLPETVTHCNCSICRRYNAVWGYYQRHEVKLSDNGSVATAYRWNDEVIDFIHCRVCGCITHYEDVEKLPESRVAVNFRMYPEDLWRDIRVRRFDGAKSFQVISDG